MCLKFLRAFEQGNLHGASLCIERYPLLADLVPNHLDFHTNPGPRLRRLREHIMALQGDLTMQELGALHADLKELDPEETIRRRQRNDRLVCRLAPGKSCTHFALMDNLGSATTDPEQMLQILKSHWSKTFAHKPMDEELCDAWMEEDIANLPQNHHTYLPTTPVPLKRFRQAILGSGNGAPGRDGIP